MDKIYLAVAVYNYEGFDVIRAFRNEDAAERFLEPFRAHMAKHPPYPTQGGLKSPEWDAFMEKANEWEAAAPPDFERGDSYRVIEKMLC